MIVVPSGTFTMGSPSDEEGRSDNEGPRNQVTIANPFAVSRFELTFVEWDTCVAYGYCNRRVGDNRWGRGRRPVINVSWDHAQSYVEWLSDITGKKYRLLSEAEYEHATRAGSQTAYPWGNDIKLNGAAMANCHGCGSQWDHTAPVGSFPPNAFGLYDMVGNVWQWTDDCYQESYKGAPADGSAWTNGPTWTNDFCADRVVRGGAWLSDSVRSASRHSDSADVRNGSIGFRVARTLAP
jgi:formylglycine-generating enzyme required for sulfatase activity